MTGGIVMSWKDYNFEIPLGVEFSEEDISGGLEWISDCEQDDIFGLKPKWFCDKNHYDAALKLCRICGGWFYFENEEEKELTLQCTRAVVQSKAGEPMWYYEMNRGSFHWVDALREQNIKYYEQFWNIDTLWELYHRLHQRSWVEKAECFQWFVDFFGEYLKFDFRNELQLNYIVNYDSQMETIFYSYPEQMKLLTTGNTAVDSYNANALSRAAAGLIRMGKRQEGLDLYNDVFKLVWDGKSTLDDKKNVVDGFLNRLSEGYENEPYLDDEICELLEKQCQQYSDAKWLSKVRVVLGRNRY